MSNNEGRISTELEQIRKKHDGILRPIDVVRFAKSPRTALHSKFEWDDAKASYEYRLWQAREVIQVEVTVIHDEPVRTYVSLVSDRTEEGGGYRKTVHVLADDDLRPAMLAEAKSDYRRFYQKYKHLKELAELFAAGEEVFGT